LSDFIKITDYAAKDALLTGNPSKLVKGTEIGADFDAVAVAVATKHDATDIGVTVQAYDADLTTWAGITPGTGIATALAVNVGTAGAPVINGGALGTPSSGTLTNCTGTPASLGLANATGLPAAGVTGTALTLAGGNLTGGINSARGNITQHATTMDFFATTSPDILDGTGSAVTITACTNAPQAGAVRKFYPIAATVLTHGATFDIAGNANLTAAAGDCWIIEAKTTSTYRVSAVKEDGTAVVASSGMPTGTIIDFGGSAAPSGYLACDGAAVSRTTYAALFTAISTLWGVGDGSTTFNVPNFAAGDAAVQTAGTVGASTDGQMPSHTHAFAAITPPANTTRLGTAMDADSNTGYQNTQSAGSGTRNFAAGKRVLKCIKT
jgi:microcystin-dependent protein